MAIVNGDGTVRVVLNTLTGGRVENNGGVGKGKVTVAYPQASRRSLPQNLPTIGSSDCLPSQRNQQSID